MSSWGVVERDGVERVWMGWVGMESSERRVLRNEGGFVCKM